MKRIRYFSFAVTCLVLCGCTTAPKKPAEETAKAEPLPAVDPFAPVTSDTKKYWERRNAEVDAAAKAERALEKARGSN